MTWQDEGVTTTVEVSTNGQFITPRPTTQIPFTSGGDKGQPAGWVAYQENIGSPYWPWFSFSTSTANSEFSIATLDANTRKDIPVGAYYRFGVTPGHTYMIFVNVRTQEEYQPNFTGPRISAWRYAGSTYRGGMTNMTYARAGMPDATNWYTIGVQLTFAADENFMEIYLLCNNTTKAPYAAGSPNFGCTFGALYYVDVTPPDSVTPYDWHTVVCDTKSAVIRYGRGRFTERYDVGTFQIILNNVSGEYMYQDEHPWGFRPGRLVKMTATKDSITYPLCFGVIDRIATTQNPDGTATVTLTVFDTTSYCSDVATPSITVQSEGSLTPFYSGVRIKSLVTYVGIPQDQQAIDQGQWGMQQVRQSSRAIREEIGVTADSEGGSFFGERDGKVIYKDRTWSVADSKGSTVQANFTAFRHGITIDMDADGIPTDPNAPVICPFSLDTDWSLERVINYIRLGAVNGSPYVFQNSPSQSEHGVRTYQRLDFVNGNDVNANNKTRLGIRAEDIFSTSLDAMLRVKRLAYRPTGTQWPFTLSVFLNWLVRVFYYNDAGTWGFSTVVRVQSIEHRITPNGWETSIDVDQPINFSDSLVPVTPGGWDHADWDATVWDDETMFDSGIWTAGYLWSNPTSKWGE